MVEAERVEELMLNDPVFQAVERIQRDHLPPPVPADGRPAPAVQETTGWCVYWTPGGPSSPPPSPHSPQFTLYPEVVQLPGVRNEANAGSLVERFHGVLNQDLLIVICDENQIDV